MAQNGFKIGVSQVKNVIKLHVNGLKWLKMTSKWLKMPQKVPKWSKTADFQVKNGLKCTIVGKKWSKWVKKWSKPPGG